MRIETNDLGDWRYGLHPHGPGAVLGQMTRVSLPLGDALRLEMTNFGSAGVVHVQYYIVGESGALALWTSCPPSQLTERVALPETMEAPRSDDPTATNGVADAR